MRRRGLTGDEIAVALQAVNSRRCDPPLEEDEVLKLAADIGSRYEPGTARASRTGDPFRARTVTMRGSDVFRRAVARGGARAHVRRPPGPSWSRASCRAACSYHRRTTGGRARAGSATKLSVSSPAARASSSVAASSSAAPSATSGRTTRPATRPSASRLRPCPRDAARPRGALVPQRGRDLPGTWTLPRGTSSSSGSSSWCSTPSTTSRPPST